MKRNARKQTRVPVSDLAELLRPYRSGWVALTPDEREVVAAGPTVEEVHAAAVQRGHLHPLLVPIIPPDGGFVGKN